MVEPVLEPGPHRSIDILLDFRIVEAVFRLALELRIGHEDAQHHDETFAYVFRRKRDAFRRELVHFDVVADRLSEAGAEAVLV